MMKIFHDENFFMMKIFHQKMTKQGLSPKTPDTQVDSLLLEEETVISDPQVDFASYLKNDQTRPVVTKSDQARPIDQKPQK